jgi:NRAMP (natural resistance-associated macrophage protein)-like metal ion transporter
MKKSPFNIFKLLGPGLITGASDDDPSGIATYSQVGAKFGFDMLWTMLISYPMMTVVQEISARIGRITGRGLAGNMRRFYSAWITLALFAYVATAFVIHVPWREALRH